MDISKASNKQLAKEVKRRLEESTLLHGFETQVLVDELARRSEVSFYDCDEQLTISVKLLNKHAKPYTIIKNLNGPMVPNQFILDKTRHSFVTVGGHESIFLTPTREGCTCHDCKIEADQY